MDTLPTLYLNKRPIINFFAETGKQPIRLQMRTLISSCDIQSIKSPMMHQGSNDTSLNSCKRSHAAQCRHTLYKHKTTLHSSLFMVNEILEQFTTLHALLTLQNTT
jgi:hypothetical protein